jgi:hypothetical protein
MPTLFRARGVTLKLFIQSEWYVGTALLAAAVWVAGEAANLNVWVSTAAAFVIAYTVRVLAMYRGWEAALAKQPPGMVVPDARPLLGQKLKGRSQRELGDLGLLAEDEPDEDKSG